MNAPVVVTLGETMALFRAAVVGSLAHVDSFELGIGGAESNVATAITRLGGSARWLGRVGNDSLGGRVARELRAEGFEVVAISDDASTGLMVKENRTSETSRVSYYRSGSAGSRLSAADVDLLDIPSAALLHVTGITSALSESAAMAIDAALDVAEANGVPVSFDVNHRASLWTGRDATGVYRRIAARSQIVFAGDDEADLLVPGHVTAEERARAIAELGPSQVVIKRGAEGCFAIVDGVEHTQKAISVRVVDTVGAGDAFVGGYLSELVAGADVQVRLGTAVTTGAFACLSVGDWEGYPTRDELALLTTTEPVTR